MDETRRRRERKSRSSSRSPSLSRRPSLKEKKGTTIGKAKGKKSSASGGKKERWLLTRKTWRYMSDAVGNLLPESHRGSGSARRPSSGDAVFASVSPGTSSGFQGGAAAHSQQQQQQQQQHHHHSADIPGPSTSAAAIRPKSMPMPTPMPSTSSGETVVAGVIRGIAAAGAPVVPSGSGSAQGSKPSSGVTSPTYGGIMSFPSHRPGVTPTGPGPGKTFSPPPSSSSQQHGQIVLDKFYPTSDDIPTLEKHFEAVCNKEKRFLLWSRTKAKGLSGPALRELKMKQKDTKDSKSKQGSGGHRDSSGSIMEALHMRLQLGGGASSSATAGGDSNKENVLAGDYYSPTEEDDDYDEYDDQDEEQITVRERRKSSTASSTSMMMGVGGSGGHCWTQGSLTFFRPLSTFSSHGSESSYAMILTPAGITKICRNTGTQTDPFPEELLIRFRLQDVQEERQQQNLDWAGQDSASRQLSPDNQSDVTTATTGGGGGSEGDSGMSPGRLVTSATFDSQKMTSPPPTTTTSPMSPTTSTEAGRTSSGSGRESQEKLLEGSDPNMSTRPSISGQESIATTATAKSSSGAVTDGTSSSGTTDKKSEESGYSSSISDTVMRYLRMVRKNSKADNKDTIDKFKTVNYDRSLRYIKSKNVSVEEALEHVKNKQKAADDAAAAAANPVAPEQPAATGESAGTGGKDKGAVAAAAAAPPPSDILSSSPVPQLSPQTASEMGATTLTTGSLHVASLMHTTASPQTITSFTQNEAVLSGPSVVTHAQLSSPKQLEHGQLQQVSNIPLASSSSLSPSAQVASISPPLGMEAEVQSPPPPPGEDEEQGIVGGIPGPPPSFPPQETSSSVGVQAGESLVRFLRYLNPSRKMSDFSSSCCSSESPAEVFTPRYSFATTVMSSTSDTELFGVQQAAMASMMAMAAAKGMQHPHHLQHLQHDPSSGDIMDPSEVDDVFQGHHYQHHIQPHQHHQHHLQQLRSSYFQSSPLPPSSSGGGALSSSWTSSATRASTTTTTIKKSSSVQQMVSFGGDPSAFSGEGCTSSAAPPVAPTTSSSSSYSLSQLFHYPSKSHRSSSHHQRDHQVPTGSGSPGTTSTPPTPTTSSMGGSSGGLMKTFFGSSPFSSTFGLGSKKGSLRKPTSTTSLTITTNTGSDSISGRGGSHNAPPPTTSSSPNLLSLIQSSAASAGTGFTSLFSSSSSRGGGSSSITSPSTTSRGIGGESGGYPQTRVSASSSGELMRVPQGSSSAYSPRSSLPIAVDTGAGGAHHLHHEPLTASSLLATSSSKSAAVMMAKHKKYDVLSSSSEHHRTGHHGSVMARGLSDLLSHVTSKGSSSMGAQTDLHLTSPSRVMQKSKSSSSVLPLYGSSGGVSGVGSGAGSTTTLLRASPSGSIGGGGVAGGVDSQFTPALESSPTPAGAAGTSSGGGGGSRLISKSKLFKSRSKSSTRATTSSSGSAICTWSPQGRCKWKSVTGKVVTLDPTNALSLSDVERLTLQDVALEKLRALNLGVDVKIPKEKVGGGQQKPKRRPYLLKKKALSTGFFESGSKREDAKDSPGSGGSGLVFGISLSQCVTNDRLRQMKAAALTASPPPATDWEAPHKRSQNGSRNSVSSVFEMPKEEKDPLQIPPLSVPVIVTACINHLESYGLHTTGIFRVSTSLKRIRQLREDIDGGKEVWFGEDHSPHDVAALLKEFLRDLPEPLLCRDLYQAFLKTQKIRNRKLQLEAIQHLVQLLPVSNRDTLAALLKFFAKVVANSSETRSKTGELLPGNKMEGYSLATLIAPNILPCMPTEGAVAASMDQNAALTKERRESIDLVNYMISNYSAIFDITAELLHDVYLHLMDTNPEAIEGILRQRCGVSDDGIDELETTSSVFEESESGELLEPDEAATAGVSTTRVYRRREDILHEGAGKGGHADSYKTSDERRERCRTRREESKERAMLGGGDGDKHHSGGESDSSSTRSTSRWFRRSRGDAKGRTSSDSGSEKVKDSRKRDSSLFESKRASSLDSVNVHELSGGGGGAAATGGSVHSAAAARVSKASPGAHDMIPSRPLSGSEQSLRVPEHLNRRQSSPVLESSGIITASLKIPVPVPLNIDDTDIPYIEDENLEGATHHQHPHHHHLQHQLHHQYLHQPHHQQPPSQQQQQRYPTHVGHSHVLPYHDSLGGVDVTQPQASSSAAAAAAAAAYLPLSSSNMAVRCRSMSTDSSVPLKTTSSSVTTTAISSPARQPSSEVSSPTGFSPPTSPPLYGTFPVEEMTARMLIGSAAPSAITSSTPSTMTALSTSPSIHHIHHHQVHGVVSSGVSPTSSHHYTSISKDMESKSAGSTPITRPKIEKVSVTSSSSSSSASTATGKKPSSIPTATSAVGSSPLLIHKSMSSTGQGAIASLAVVTPKIGDTIGTKSAPPSPQPSSSAAAAASAVGATTAAAGGTPSSSTYIPCAVEPKGLGKETKGANIGGLIKSKTADFEKITKTTTSPITETELFSGTPTTQIYSIAPKMRLRSQENVLLKQQFLLRQQQHQEGGGGERRRPSGTITPREQATSPEGGATEDTTPVGPSRPLARRRLVGSASSSAIVGPSSSSTKQSGGTTSSSQRVRGKDSSSQTSVLDVRKDSSGTSPSPVPPPPSAPGGSSPSRWKRSEIIASRQQSQSSTDPETFV